MLSLTAWQAVKLGFFFAIGAELFKALCSLLVDLLVLFLTGR